MLVLAMEFSRGKRAPKALLLAKDERSPRRGAASPLGGTRGAEPARESFPQNGTESVDQ
jgi:hypothetical protein